MSVNDLEVFDSVGYSGLIQSAIDEKTMNADRRRAFKRFRREVGRQLPRGSQLARLNSEIEKQGLEAAESHLKFTKPSAPSELTKQGAIHRLVFGWAASAMVDSRVEQRVAAVEVISKLKSSDHILRRWISWSLIPFLDDEDDAVVEAAMGAACRLAAGGSFQSERPSSVNLSIFDALERSPRVALAAASLLANLQDPFVVPLTFQLAFLTLKPLAVHADEQFRRQAIAGLTQLNASPVRLAEEQKAVTEVLIEAAEDQVEDLARRAIEGLAASDCPDALDYLEARFFRELPDPCPAVVGALRKKEWTPDFEPLKLGQRLLWLKHFRSWKEAVFYAGLAYYKLDKPRAVERSWQKVSEDSILRCLISVTSGSSECQGDRLLSVLLKHHAGRFTDEDLHELSAIRSYSPSLGERPEVEWWMDPGDRRAVERQQQAYDKRVSEAAGTGVDRDKLRAYARHLLRKRSKHPEP